MRGLVRSREKADDLMQLGVEPVFGDLDDSALLENEARQSDAVINAASSDHREAVEALIRGLAGSEKPLIHTSGTSLIGEPAAGDNAGTRIFTEDTPLVVGPDKQARFAIDTLVREASGVRGIVLCNSLIYGEGTGLQRHSVQIPPLVKYALDHRSVRVVGSGLNRWSTVHIADVTDLYSLALSAAPANAFYFVENGDASFGDIADALSRRLKLPRGEGLSEKEAVQIWGYNRARYSLGGNSRVKGVRARAELGWRPKFSSVVDWIEQEMLV